jgi:rhamnogalacturonyl hydrolase YesR
MRVADSRLSSRMNRGWQGGTYMDGVMALYEMTKNRKYLDTVIAWGDRYQWLPHEGGNAIGAYGDTIRSNFDSYCCLHAYFEVFEQDTAAANFHRVKAATVSSSYLTYVDPPPFGGNNSDPVWPIFDHLYMSAPNLAYAGRVLHDTVMFDSLYRFYKNNAERHHYCERDGLWGTNVINLCRTNPDIPYWAQGNGWVSGSLCLIHKNLPRGRAGTAWFESMIRAHISSLVSFQDPGDGLWRSDINHPDVYPSKETSGSVFFLYEILYAINAGIVERSVFEPAARKAWTGLLGCIQANNRIGYAQGAWSSAGPVNPADNNEWTDGGFCLAGNELYKLLSSSSTSSAPGTHAPHQAMPRGPRLFTLDSRRVWIPANARGFEVYDLRGRLLYRHILNTPGRDRSVVLPAQISRPGAVAVRFVLP